MIVIDKLKIAFENVPKVGSTSLFSWLYLILLGKNFASVEKKPIHAFFNKRFKAEGSELIRIVDKSQADKLKAQNYFIFCLTRDPVKRVLSVYRNRVIFHKELDLSKVGGAKCLEVGLKAKPTLRYFIEKLPEYQQAVPTIMHHSQPMVDFLGHDSTIYSKIYDISAMNDLRDDLIKHWGGLQPALSEQDIPVIPRLQVGGPKLGLEAISRSELDYLLGVYADDYKALPQLSQEKTIAEWQKAFAEKALPESAAVSDVKVVLRKELPEELTHVWVSPECKPVVNQGDVTFNLSGIFMLDAGISEHGLKFYLKDALGMTEVSWGLPSPKLAERFPENAHAPRARFDIPQACITGAATGEVFMLRPTGVLVKLMDLLPA